MAKSDAPFKRRKSTEKAPDKRDKGPSKPGGRHPLDPPKSKDPKKKGSFTGDIGQL